MPTLVAKENTSCLVIDDNPITQQFLSDTLKNMTAQVDCVAHGYAAITQVQQRRYDIWLIDMHLPDQHGNTLVDILRHYAHDTIAIGHSADTKTSLDVSKKFDHFFYKPISQHRLLQIFSAAVTRHHAHPSQPATPDARWDDPNTLQLYLHHSQVRALRALFLQELPNKARRIQDAFHQQRYTILQNQLHQLVASCGFVGAKSLSQAARTLKNDPQSSHHYQQFIATVYHFLDESSS